MRGEWCSAGRVGLELRAIKHPLVRLANLGKAKNMGVGQVKLDFIFIICLYEHNHWIVAAHGISLVDNLLDWRKQCSLKRRRLIVQSLMATRS